MLYACSADDRFGVFLGWSREDSANAQVVCAAFRCGKSFSLGVRCHAYDGRRTKDLTCAIKIDVVLTNMHSLNTSSKRDINPVIDQQRDIGRFGDLVKVLGDTDEIACVTDLVAILDDCCALAMYQWM